MNVLEEIEEVGKLTPLLIRVYSDSKRRVATAKAASSAGGATVTAAEIAAIVEAEVPLLTHAITQLLTDLA